MKQPKSAVVVANWSELLVVYATACYDILSASRMLTWAAVSSMAMAS